MSLFVSYLRKVSNYYKIKYAKCRKIIIFAPD